jgi:PAN domain
MRDWIGKLLAGVISGVLIYWLTVGLIKNSKSSSGASGTAATKPTTTNPTVQPAGNGNVSLPPHTTGGIVVPPPPALRMSPLEMNINRQGSDIRSFLTNTAEQCSAACLSERSCRAMTFVRRASDGICWLKNAEPGPTRQPGMISAVKQF